MISLTELHRVATAATAGKRVNASPDIRCVMPEHSAGHPGPPLCRYGFQGWIGPDDAPDDRYFSRFVSWADPPMEMIGSTDYGPMLVHADAEQVAAFDRDTCLALVEIARAAHEVARRWPERNDGDVPRMMYESALDVLRLTTMRVSL